MMKTMYHPDYQLMHSCCNSCTLAHDACDVHCCQTYIYIYIYREREREREREIDR